MFEGYSAETWAGKIPLVPMGVRAEGPACADPGSETPIGASGIFFITFLGGHNLPSETRFIINII